MKKVITILVLAFLMVTNANAQWQQTNGPFGGEVKALAISGTNIFAGTWGAGDRKSVV